MSLDPGDTLDTKDPGDDTQRRFRYQHAYAAIQCAKLLHPDCKHDTVYCENFEDILLRKKTGAFEGVQVKTRQFKGEPFKSSDAALKKSIARFAELEKKFPGKFEAYHFVSSGFISTGRHYASLPVIGTCSSTTDTWEAAGSSVRWWRNRPP